MPFDHVAFRLRHGIDPDGGPMGTQREVAAVLRWSRERVRRWTVAERIPHVRDADTGWPVYPLAALDAWLEQRTERAA